MTSHISIKNLTIRYGDLTAIDDVSLDIPRNASTVILGESGCGKSTLLRAVAGLQSYAYGNIFIDGDGSKIGFMPQTYGLLPWQTARENILLPHRIGKRFIFHCGGNDLPPQEETRLFELMTQLGIEDLSDRYPREMSGGQKQRVALARVFFARTPILLMDEPFSALDAITREEMQRVFGRLRKNSRPTTILVTHDVEEALALGDQIVIMKKNPTSGGQIAAVLSGEFCDGDNRESAEFFAAGNEIRKILAAGKEMLA